MVEQEATRAEAANPDEEAEEATEAEGETEQPSEPEEPPQPPAPGALSVEQAGELEAALKAYYKRVEKALGKGNVPPECPTCGGLGFDLTGGGGELPLREHSQFEACADCGGYGGVKTGSHVPGQDVQPCPRCKGAGYLVLPPNEPAQPHLVAPVVEAMRQGVGGIDLSQLPKPGEPGYEPWMGGGAEGVPAPANAGGAA